MEGIDLFGWKCQKFKSCKTLDLVDSISLAKLLSCAEAAVEMKMVGGFSYGGREKEENEEAPVGNISKLSSSNSP